MNVGSMTPISNTLPQDGATPCFQRRSRIVAYRIQVRFRLVTRAGGAVALPGPSPRRRHVPTQLFRLLLQSGCVRAISGTAALVNRAHRNHEEVRPWDID